MSILDFARIVVYRFHEKGLEVFLVNSDLANDPDVWKLPDANLTQINDRLENDDFIELDIHEGDEAGKVIAIEGDWHTMPSIRGLVKHDVKIVKSMVKDVLPGIKKGAFFAIKDVVKKVLPNEYKAVKELKEILVDRNTIRNI